jgi:hypothetical protein
MTFISRRVNSISREETIPMSETLRVLPRNQTHEQSEKYTNFQIKGWTNFDLTDKTLGEIAEGIEQGGGSLTLLEVLKVEDDLASIVDEEVRECFENILAAKRLVQNVHELPKKLIEELRAALKTEEEIVPPKTVAESNGAPAECNSAAGNR